MTIVVARTLAATLVATLGAGPVETLAQLPPSEESRYVHTTSSVGVFSLERITHLLERDSERPLSGAASVAFAKQLAIDQQSRPSFKVSVQGNPGSGLGHKIVGVLLAGAGVAMILAGANKYHQAKQGLAQCDFFEESVPGCFHAYDRQATTGQVLGSAGISAAIIGVVLIVR